jgi:hypothetical protein
MARFNQPIQTKTRVRNVAGGESFKESPKVELASLMLTSFVQEKFYRSAAGDLNRLNQLVKDIGDKKFCAQAAVYARVKFGMRSITHATAAFIADMIKGEEWARRFYDKIVFRPDDMLEIMALYHSINDRLFTHAMRKGFRQAFNRFDGYQLAKYRKEDKAISLIDLVNLAHPKPSNKNSEALAQLVKDTLRSDKTWETMQTRAGQTAETEEEKETLKAENWKKLINERKLGYLALLRNLRNIMTQANEETFGKALVMLDDEKLIRKAKIFPFQFINAYNAVREMGRAKGVREAMGAIEIAINTATDNVPEYLHTVVHVDNSGSMHGGFGHDPATTACLFAAVMFKRGADVISFSDTAKWANLDPAGSTMAITKELYKESRPSGTNFHAPWELMTKGPSHYQRVFIFSDMQGWMHGGQPGGSVAQFERAHGRPFIYSINLNDYGTLMFPEDRVFLLAGFSEKIFDIMAALETDKDAMIHEIEKIEL